jgi:hypothetical protein
VGPDRTMRSAFIVRVAMIMIAAGTDVVFLLLKRSPVTYRFLISGMLIIALGVHPLWDALLR